MLLMLNLYSPHYKVTFAFSILLYPQPGALGARLTSRFAFPLIAGEEYGLTTFRVSTKEWVRSRLFAGDASSAVDEFEASTPGHLPFGSSLSAPLACHTSRRLSAIHIC